MPTSSSVSLNSPSEGAQTSTDPNDDVPTASVDDTTISTGPAPEEAEETAQEADDDTVPTTTAAEITTEIAPEEGDQTPEQSNDVPLETTSVLQPLATSSASRPGLLGYAQVACVLAFLATNALAQL